MSPAGDVWRVSLGRTRSVCGGCQVQSHLAAPCLQTLYIAFPGAFAGDLMARLTDTVACSAGAACHSKAGGDAASATLSHTLEAMRVPHALGTATLRLSLGKYSTEDDVDRAADTIVEAVAGSIAASAAAAVAAAAAGGTSVPAPSSPALVPASLPAPSPSPVVAATAASQAAAAPATAPLYLDDTELYACTAELVADLEATPEGALVEAPGGGGGSWGAAAAPFTHALVLSHTVAHPQGGGQPADKGVVAVRTAEGAAFFEFGLVKPATGPAALPGALLHFGRWLQPPPADDVAACESWLSWLDLASGQGQAAAAAVATVASEAWVTAPRPAGIGRGAAAAVHISAPLRRLAARLHSAGHILDLAMQVRVR